jgi:hypothetical protein
MTTLTHAVLDHLLEEHRRGAMLDGTKEHEAFVVSAIEYMPQLIEAVRSTIPGETLAEIRIPGFVPRGTLNSRDGHWGARQRRVKAEHERVGVALAAGARKLRNKHEHVGRVVITRLSPTMLDSDNCGSSLKGTRDSVAKWLGVDDGAPGIVWAIEQRKVSKKDAGTIIRIEARVT